PRENCRGPERWRSRAGRADSSSRAAETTGAAARGREHRDELPLRARHRGDDELRDAIAAAHDEGRLAVVDEDHLHLAAVVAVDRAGGVEDADALPQRAPPS